MPLHDWTKTGPGIYHHFHRGWCWQISQALNQALPDDYQALIEQRSRKKEPDVVAVELFRPRSTGRGSHGTAVLEKPKTRIIRELPDDEHYAAKASRIAIRHQLGRVVAFIEIVSPGNKASKANFDDFLEKIVESVREGVHVLVVDPFPPSPRDPFGIHKAIWDHFHDEDFELTRAQNRVLVSYQANGSPCAFVETVGLGETLPDMPLFFERNAHVLVPLEMTYAETALNSPLPE